MLNSNTYFNSVQNSNNKKNKKTKMNSGSFKNVINKMCLQNRTYLISMYEKDLVAQWVGVVEYTDCLSTPTSVLDMTQNNLMVTFQQFWDIGMQRTPLLPSLPGPLRPEVVAPDRVLSMGQIELNCVLMINWITWNRKVFCIETVLMQNWIVWNRTVLTLKWFLC